MIEHRYINTNYKYLLNEKKLEKIPRIYDNN
jgi:hypothetical protein